MRQAGQWRVRHGEFSSLHALAIDSQGRLFIGDRDNNRIPIYDQDGKYLDCWYQFSRPSGIFIDANDNMFVTDSESKNPRTKASTSLTRDGSAGSGSAVQKMVR